jgi:hypothetical protein
MRHHIKRPSPAMGVALIALFLALGGTTYAATGGNFILGQTNSANAQSSLSASVATKALQLTNSSTTAGATALGLTVASGHAPFSVSSSTKVANLNADKLDGLDSAALQKRVTGACTGANAIKSVAADGSVACQSTRAQLVLSTWAGIDNQGPVSFTTDGGPALAHVACSGYRAFADHPGLIDISVSLDGTVVGDTLVFTNETDSHKATIPISMWFPNLAAGSHSIDFFSPTETTTDGSDFCHVLVLDQPG